MVHVERARAQAVDAHAWTDSLVWRTASDLPWLGSAFQSVRDSAAVIDRIATDLLMPLSRVADNMLGDDSGGVAFDLPAIAAAVPDISSAETAASGIAEEAAAIDNDTAIGPVNNAVTELQDMTQQLSTGLSTATVAAQLAPSMLGGYGARAYLLAFQTPSEARGTGGLFGSWAVLGADNGHVAQISAGSNADLTSPGHLFRTDPAPADLGAEWHVTWDKYNAVGLWRDSNFSPHFPYAAKLFKGVFEKTFNAGVSGVISTDPVALQYILEATGPVTLPEGEEITADNVVDITMNQAYFRYPRFPDDQAARKAFLGSIQQEVVNRLTGESSKGPILAALARAAVEGRLQVWSVDPREQALLEQTPLAHIVPDSDAPFAAVSINSGSGSKLDYYLEREISYTGQRCVGDRRRTEVKVRLTNTAPSDVDFPTYLQPSPYFKPSGPPGTNRVVLMVYETKGAKTIAVTQDGKAVIATPRSERDRPIDALVVTLKPGQSTEIVFELDEPSVPGKPQMLNQPLTDDPKIVFDVPECRPR